MSEPKILLCNLDYCMDFLIPKIRSCSGTLFTSRWLEPLRLYLVEETEPGLFNVWYWAECRNTSAYDMKMPCLKHNLPELLTVPASPVRCNLSLVRFSGRLTSCFGSFCIFWNRCSSERVLKSLKSMPELKSSDLYLF